MAEVRLTGLTKRFGAITALDSLSLTLAANQVTALLGPSGCGKTTLLRLIAGLETPQAGRIEIGDRDVTALPPERRRIGLMFQSYALFPHMTVAENLRFPLRMRGGIERADQADRVSRALALVRLPDVGARYPKQLSGGQQQRIAFARALIGEPDVLLLDEPLSNLDARLRDGMQMELLELRRQMALTMVIVTHDQTEALSLADHIVLMRDGRIEQQGAPEAVYAAPATGFAADFLGGANLIPVVVADGRAILAPGISVPLHGDAPPGPAQLMIRPEHVRLGGTPSVTLAAEVTAAAFRGDSRHLVAIVAGVRIKIAAAPDQAARAGDGVVIGWDPAQARLLPR